jgi:hypothetical protein
MCSPGATGDQMLTVGLDRQNVISSEAKYCHLHLFVFPNYEDGATIHFNSYSADNAQ